MDGKTDKGNISIPNRGGINNYVVLLSSYERLVDVVYNFKLLTCICPIPVNLWELLGGRSPPTNSSKGEILCVAFKRTKLYLW
jgi:hypothetical protein